MVSAPGPDSFPGETANAVDVFQLAEEYRRAADALAFNINPKRPLSRLPHHLTAIHAIELYLNALLLFEGIKPCELRKMHHDLSARIEHELSSVLKLRSKTAAHLVGLSKNREYLVSRYGTDVAKTMSPLNRVEVTLTEVRKKVATRLGKGAEGGQ